MNSETKTFVFKLAEKKTENMKKWKAREGVSIAGCTISGPDPSVDLRYMLGVAPDAGQFC